MPFTPAPAIRYSHAGRIFSPDALNPSLLGAATAPVAVLADAGIDKKLSSHAQKLAATLRASIASASATAAKASASTAFCQAA